MAATSAAAESLHEAQGDEPFHGARAEAEQGGGDEENQSAIQRQLAPKAVEQRAVKKLAGRHARKVAGERERNPGGGRVQGGGHLGKRREIHVNGERADGGQRAKDDDDQGAVVGLGHKIKATDSPFIHVGSGRD
jgi:hypothetical protein